MNGPKIFDFDIKGVAQLFHRKLYNVGLTLLLLILQMPNEIQMPKIVLSINKF